MVYPYYLQYSEKVVFEVLTLKLPRGPECARWAAKEKRFLWVAVVWAMIQEWMLIICGPNVVE